MKIGQTIMTTPVKFELLTSEFGGRAQHELWRTDLYRLSILANLALPPREPSCYTTASLQGKY